MAIREGRWDCQYCGTTGIPGREKVCPNCARSRPEGTKSICPTTNPRSKMKSCAGRQKPAPIGFVNTVVPATLRT